MLSAARLLTGNLALGAAYAGLGWLGLILCLPGTNAAPLWPAAGLALAALWRWGPAIAPGIAVGALLADHFGFGLSWWASAITGLGAAGAALLAWLVLRWTRADRTFTALADVLRFTLAGVVAAAAAALVGTSVFCLDHGAWTGWPPAAWTWFAGDLVGILVAAPLLAVPNLRTDPKPGWAETTAIAIAVIAAPLAVFTAPGSGMVSFLAVPPLVWAALRLGPAGAAEATVAIAVLAWIFTASGAGPLAQIADPLLRGMLLQAYLGTAAVTALLLAASARSRDLAIRERCASEERYRLVAENAHDLVCLHGLDMTCRWVSPSVRTLLGLGPEALLGRDLLMLLHPDDIDRVRNDALVPLLTDHRPVVFQARCRNADGGWVWLEIDCQVVPDDAGRIIAIRTVSRDITARRNDEAALEQARRSATLAERMAAIGTLAGGVAHEFNNLNAVILGNVEMALAKLDLPKEARSRLEMVREAVYRERGIVDALLTFSQSGPSMQETVEIGGVVSTTIALARRTLRQRQVTLHVELPEAPMFARIPIGALGQILLNLLLNACDAIDRRHDPQVWIRLERHGARARLSVRDNGIGIRPEDLTRIFTPFFSTKGANAGEDGQSWLKGTGLGLSVCQTLVSQIGGTIAVESAPDAGATFTISIPLAEAPQPAHPPPPRPDACSRVLVVDDEPEIRRLLAEHLASAGHLVVEAEDGGYALDRLDREDIDLVLLNWNMPRVDGEAFLEHLELHPERRWPPVVVVSGWMGAESGIHRWRRDLAGELRKPFTLDQVRDTVHNALHGVRPDRFRRRNDEESSLLPGP